MGAYIVDFFKNLFFNTFSSKSKIKKNKNVAF